MKSTRAFIDPLTLGLICGLLGGVFVGTFKPFLGFHKGPPTKEVTQLQADLTAAQQDKVKAVGDLTAAQAAERAKLESQVRAAQVDGVGVAAAIKRAPSSAETALAARMADRVNLKLATAIGKLPEDQQQAMLDLIDQALSGKQAEIDAANVKLAKADADFRALTSDRDAIKAQIPVLVEKAAKAEEKAQSVQSALTVKTNEVVTWAAAKDEADKRAGSFFGAFSTMRHWAMGIGGVALVVAAVALYLRMGLGSVGAALHPLQKELSPEVYAKVVTSLDSGTDRLHQWLISGGRKAAAAIEAKLKPTA